MSKKKPKNKKAAKESREKYDKNPKPTTGIKKVDILKPAKGDSLAVFTVNKWGALRLRSPLILVEKNNFDYEDVIAEKYGSGKFEIHLLKPASKKENKYGQKSPLSSVARCELELVPA